MSDTPRDITLERINRLSQAVADLMDSHAAHARQVAGQLDRIESNIQALTKQVGTLASEQILLGNRVENAFSRAFRANLRLDDIEDSAP